MGAEKEIIVAFELGSSAIRGIAGRREADGGMHILAVEQERVTDIIRRGVIYNIDKTRIAIERIKERLNSRLDADITRCYVGIAGQSVHTVPNQVNRVLEGRIKVDQALVDSLKDENMGVQYPDHQILEVVPQEYHMGNYDEQDPIGTQTDQIEGRFLNVIARTHLQENIRRCMREAGLDVVELLVTPLAVADSILPDTEKRSGCALVDFGAETTTVSIYIKNILRHLVTIPLGGKNLTKDVSIVTKVDFAEAEALKRKYGVAYIAEVTNQKENRITISNDREVNELELQNIICARVKEIICNVEKQIKNWQEDLLSGITLTGAAASLPGMPEAVARLANFEPNRIKVAKNLADSLQVKREEMKGSASELNAVLALLLHGTESCIAEKVEEQVPDEEELQIEPADAEENGQPTEEETPVEEQPAEETKKKGPSIWGKMMAGLKNMVEGDE